jgi:hypothetical protein
MQDCQQRLGSLLVPEPTWAPAHHTGDDDADLNADGAEPSTGDDDANLNADGAEPGTGDDDANFNADGAESGETETATSPDADPAHIDDDTGADAPAVTRRPVEGWWHGGKWILPTGRYVQEAVADDEPPPRMGVWQRPAGRPSSSPPVDVCGDLSASSSSRTPPARPPPPEPRAEQPAADDDEVVYDISEPVRRPGESEHSFKKRQRAAVCSRRRQSGAPALRRVVEVPMCAQCHVHQPGAYCAFRLCAPCCRRAAGNRCQQPGHSD